ncbi:MAG: divergent polysaccharide deacetylase family protein [Treponema sp.]|nr:divergent polysaccharide deacetylase family protein [Treponema sp.]
MPKLPSKRGLGKKSRSGSKSKRKRKLTRADAVRAIAVAGSVIILSALISLFFSFGRDRDRVEKETVITEVVPPESGPPETGPVRPAVPEVSLPEPVKPPPVPAEERKAEDSPPAKPGVPEPAGPGIPEAGPASPGAVKAKPEETSPVSPGPQVSKPAASSPPKSTPQNTESGRQAPAARPEIPPKGRGTVVFVIDDAGNNLRELEPFLRYPGPLTIAVLPGLPHSAEAAGMIRKAGKEVFLHQPMEALGGQNPGPGALYTGMGPGDIRAVIETNIAGIGPIAGMNNHQGSRITEDEAMMETVLALCREQGIYFLDSRTTAATAVPSTARRLGITIGERDIFIDNEQDRASMIHYIEEGLKKAVQKGSAVMIGHTWSPALAPVLTELYPRLLEQGYSFSTASALIRSKK